MDLFNIDTEQLANTLIPLAVAFILPMLTAYNRESEARTAGIRTFPLVSMAACGFTIIALSMFQDPEPQARMLSGIITGIGFIGGGAILKNSNSVSGVATAAAIWSTGAVGMAVGLGRLEIALSLSLMTFVVFWSAKPVKREIESSEE